METRVAYAAVGAFVLALSALFVFLALWLGANVSNKTFAQYQILTRDSVGGLSVGSAVKYLGVQVGSVRSIDLANSEQVRIVLDVDASIPLKTDTTAVLAAQGVTGLAQIELSGGTADAPLLRGKSHDGELPTIAMRPSLLRRLDVAVNRTLDNVDDIAGQVKAILNEQNQAELARILSNLALVSETMAQERQQISRLLDNSVRMTASAEKAMASAPQVMNQLNSTLQSVQEMTGSFKNTSQNISNLSQSLQTTAQRTEQEIQLLRRNLQPEVDTLLSQSTATARALEALLRELNRDPSSVLRGAPVAQPGPGER